MTKYIIGVVVVLLIGGGVWWYLQPNGEKPVAATAPTAPAVGEKPWIEVVTATATAVNAKGVTTTLATGDEVAAGVVIKTNVTGVVLVHFPDGSFAKLDPNSSITITEASYDTSSGVSNVHVTLGTGTLWSKVLDLVGISSSWQVETSNAVATVRGTSFMTSITKGKTKVVGIEHKVAVTPLRPDTHQPLALAAEVTSDAQVVIDDTHIAALASGKEQLATTTMSADISKNIEYKAFKEREKAFDAVRDSLNAQVGNGAEFRKEFRDAQVKDFEVKILEQREKNNPPPEQPSSLDQTKDQTNTAPIENTPVDTKTKAVENPVRPAESPVKTPVEKTTPPVSPAMIVPPPQRSEEVTSGRHPVSLSVVSSRDLSQGVTENETVSFHAILLSSDNSKKDVTDSVAWNVINNIGSFPTPGNFHAELSPDYAELGEVPGAVYATFKGEGGKELNAASKQFTIHAYVPPETSTAG